jgi:hypothetical protein
MYHSIQTRRGYDEGLTPSLIELCVWGSETFALPQSKRSHPREKMRDLDSSAHSPRFSDSLEQLGERWGSELEVAKG